MVAPPKMMGMGRSSSTSSLSRKMSKFGSALGGGTKKGSSSSSSHHQLLLPKVANAPKDTDATRKLQAAINRRAQRRNNRQKVTDIKKSTSADADPAPSLYADPSIDALTIPTASFSLSQDSQDTHGSAGSANSASSTDSLNALARENTPLKKKKTAARGRHVGIATTISADGDEEEKDDCKDMFTPIVPRKKGRPPKRMLPNTVTGVQQHNSNPVRDHPAEELLERAKARNEAMQRKQMEEERSKKERRDRYQALSQLVDKSEATIKVDNTNVLGGIDAPVNTNRGRNGTPYVPKQPVATAPPPALSYSFSACSEVTYSSPTACEDSGHSGDGNSLNSIKRTASHASHRTSSTHVSSAAQPLYESQSLHVNDADDRIRYVRFTDVVTTFDDAEEKNTGARSLGTGGDGQPHESPFVKMHNVKHNYVGGEENRSEFEIELESKMMEHDIEVQRVGCHAQVSTATTRMQLSNNEATIQVEAHRQAQQQKQRQQYSQKGSSPTFANPLSPDSLLDGANGAYSLRVDRTCREITYDRQAAVGASRGPTISQTTEGFIELEAPEAVHAEYLLRKPTLSFGSAVSDVTASTIRHTNTGEFSSIDGDAEAKEYMYARATANTFKRPPSQTSSSNPSIGGAMQQPEPNMSFFGSLADSLTQKLRDCVQPSYDQAVLQSPPPAKMAPPAGIGGRLRDCIAPRREFMVHSPHPAGANKGMMSI